MIGELSVLVVEDHDFQREMIVEMVRRLKPKDLYSAGDGQKALEVLSKAPVDVIISDIDMPTMDGLEFMRRLSETPNRSSVIIASAIPPALLAATEAMTKSYGINLLGIIQKPVTPSVLETMLVLHSPAVARTEGTTKSSSAFTLQEIMDGLQQDQFQPFFQPRVELATRRVVGAEALARWCHPQQGVISPSAFVHVLEEADKIDELMWVMLKKSVAFCAAMKAAGRESSVAVKLALKSLNNVELANRVTEIARAENVGSDRICFEISESAATTNLGAALENLTRLSMKGFLLSLDDFGTAHSSLQQLKRIPLTELKIDRTFVTGADTKKDAQIVLKASLDMARQLKIKAWAEGVETQQDWDFLQELGFDLAQGYFIAKPMTADAYRQWMDDLASDPTSIFIA